MYNTIFRVTGFAIIAVAIQACSLEARKWLESGDGYSLTLYSKQISALKCEDLSGEKEYLRRIQIHTHYGNQIRCDYNCSYVGPHYEHGRVAKALGLVTAEYVRRCSNIHEIEN